MKHGRSIPAVFHQTFVKEAHGVYLGQIRFYMCVVKFKPRTLELYGGWRHMILPRVWFNGQEVRRRVDLGDNSKMVRMQISFEKEEYDLSKAHAALLEISLAEFVRRAVREKLAANGEGAWMIYAGFFQSNDPSSNQSIDETVYGTDY